MTYMVVPPLAVGIQKSNKELAKALKRTKRCEGMKMVCPCHKNESIIFYLPLKLHEKARIVKLKMTHNCKDQKR